MACAKRTDELNSMVDLGQTINNSAEDSDYPDNCNPRQLTNLIMNFFEAYNHGDQEKLSSYFPRTFQWYSDEVDSVQFVTRPGNRDDLLIYFAERHEQNEQLKLQSLSVTPPNKGGSNVNIAFVYRRQAEDVLPGLDGVTRVGGGKGVITCQNQKIFVWSMATAAPHEDEDEYQWSCTEESESLVCVE